jgi:hypothetical protein
MHAQANKYPLLGDLITQFVRTHNQSTHLAGKFFQDFAAPRVLTQLSGSQRKGTHDLGRGGAIDSR